MAQRKAHEVEAWLARPDPGKLIFLVYGPDRGLVSERAARLAAWTGLSAADPFSVVRLDAAELEQDPGRLIDEASTVPMFSDRRLIWVRNAGGAGKGLAEAVKRLAKLPAPQAVVLIEAGDLRKGSALRSAVEGAEAAIALPCYADEGRDIDALIDQTVERAGLQMALDARRALRPSLGGDRLASRGELEKLVLYAHGKGRIELADVQASTGDVSAQSADEVLDAVLDGRLEVFDKAFGRLSAQAGPAANQLLGAALRQFHALALLRSQMDGDGRSAASAVAAAKPPVFFSRKKRVEAAIGAWDGAALARAAASLQAAVLSARTRPELALAIARQALLAIAAESARRLR